MTHWKKLAFLNLVIKIFSIDVAFWELKDAEKFYYTITPAKVELQKDLKIPDFRWSGNDLLEAIRLFQHPKINHAPRTCIH
jgi:hypothetical protein